MTKSKLSKIRLSYYQYYDNEKYLNKTELIQDAILPDGNFLNVWPDVKYKYSTSISISTNGKHNIFIPLKLLFGKITDWELFGQMAIIENLKPDIEFEYYKIGEKYGPSENSVTKKEASIIKYFFCVENGKKIPLTQLAQNFIKENSYEKLMNVVENYFDKIDDEISELDERAEQENYRAQNREQHFEDNYYNDNLDLDQQSPEFWDNI